jgi:hypothetical protein
LLVLKYKIISCLSLTHVIVFLFLAANYSSAQTTAPKIGAYYFDGWSGKSFHITDDLKTNYPDREPKWGWVTSTPKIVNEQVKLAADVGLSFFSFCWYYSKTEKLLLNQALDFYKVSKNVKKLEYCLLVANHAGHEVGPEDWDNAKEMWVNEFKHPQYLKTGGKPLLIFFEHGSLVKRFGSPEAVKAAFESLRQYAVSRGLPGVTIAICEGSPGGIKIAEACGADLITGYNYHSLGFVGKEQAIPIEKMQVSEQKHWDVLGKATSLKYIPVSTVGWDPRPWSNAKNMYSEKPYFTGFNDESVKNSVTGLVDWMKNNPGVLPHEKIGLLYAWNENGEGAWLTPGKTGLNPSLGVKKALKKK